MIKDPTFLYDAAGVLVYFDANVFDPRDDLTGVEDPDPLILDALRSQRIRLVFDLDCFLEPLLAFRGPASDAGPRAARQLERMLKWCDRRRIVASPQWLLAQAVLSYSGQPIRVEEFLNSEQLDEQVRSELANWDQDLSPRKPFWQGIASDAQRERDSFQEGFVNLLRELGPRDGFAPGAGIPPPEEFWNAYKYRVAQTFVEGVGAEFKRPDLWQNCSARSIDSLLGIRCMSLAVGVTVGYMYAHFYNEGRQIPRVRQGDAADIRHAIAASVADIFVTNDSRLYKRLSAVPIKGFKIVQLSAFLARLQTSASR